MEDKLACRACLLGHVGRHTGIAYEVPRLDFEFEGVRPIVEVVGRHELAGGFAERDVAGDIATAVGRGSYQLDARVSLCKSLDYVRRVVTAQIVHHQHFEICPGLRDQ